MSRVALAAYLAAILLLSTLARADTAAWTPIVDTTLVGIASGGTDGSVLLARRQNQDPVRSVDGGLTWSAFSVLGVRPDRFIPSPTDARVFYALSGGVAVDYTASPGPSRLYRTRDGGATWELVASAFVSPAGAALGDLVVGAHPDLVFASRMEPSSCFGGNCAFTGAEAFVSTDGARTWRSIDAGLASNGRLVYPSISDARVVYATTSRGIYRSDNQGATWMFLQANPTDPYFYPSIYGSQVLVDRADPMLVYMYPKATEVWISEDGGANWRISDPGPVPGPYRSMLIDPTISGRVFLLGDEGEVFQSDDRARSWKRVAPSSGVSYLGGATGSPRDTYAVLAANGARRLFLAVRSAPRRLDLASNAFALGSDLWWNPAESGMGVSISQHESGQMFVGWYAYDGQGRSTWRFVSGGTWQDDRTFTGGLNEASGPAFFQGTFDPARFSARTIGTVTLRFDDSNNATFSYRLATGEAGEKRLTRYIFGPKSNAQHENYSDTWWNPTESGWGMSISTQYGTLVAIWFVYDEAGRPTWIVLSTLDVRLSVEGSFLRPQYYGDIYAARGPAAGEPFDPARVVLTKVGTASVTFPTRTAARVEWSAFGQTGSRSLARLPF